MLTTCSNAEWTVNRASCKCVDKGGDDVETVCALNETDCKLGSHKSDKECKCVGCPPYVSGATCDVCELKESDCARNSSLNTSSCKCEINCPFGLGGAKCDKCNMSVAVARCKHANEATEVDEATCKCKNCEAGWGGETCNKCMTPPSFCGVGGVLDPDTCTCKCKGQWTLTQEGSCTHCNISKCLHGGHLNLRTCSCNCSSETASWSGVKCDSCPVNATKDTCNSHGTWSKGKCGCKCSNNWYGKFCNTCGLQNSACSKFNTTLDAEKCECKCLKSESTCNKFQKFERSTCSCVPNGLCDKTCGTGKRLDKDRCECVAAEEPCPLCVHKLKKLPMPIQEEFSATSGVEDVEA
jgi:hypothetical protein